MAFFNGNKAYIDGQGNLTLGADLNDPNFDATDKYAKGDVFVDIPLARILYAAGDTAAWTSPIAANAIPARTTGAAGVGIAALTIARNVLGNFLIPLEPPFYRTLSAANNAQNQSVTLAHGAKLRAVTISYRVVTSALQAAPTFKVFSRAFATNGADAPANVDMPVTYTVGGVVTTAANLPKDAHATHVNVIRAVVTTPAFNNTLGTQLFAEFQAQPGNNGATDVLEFLGAFAEWSVALY